MENRRLARNYFPEPRFQLKLIGLLVGGACLQIAVTCSILYYFLHQNYVLLIQYADLDAQMKYLLVRELKLLSLAIGSTFSLFLAGTVWLGVMFSHRIAGPLYAMKRTIQRLRQGHDAVLTLRDGDEFTELAEGFNHLVTELKQSQGSRKAGA